MEMSCVKAGPAQPSLPQLSYESHNSQFVNDACWIVLTTPLAITNTTISSLNEQLLELPPQKRYAHSACVIGNTMYIFGGLNSSSKGGNL